MKLRLGFTLLLFGCSSSEAPDFVQTGVAALVRLQDSEGAWKSRVYPDMKLGPALTSLALFTLSCLPPEMQKPHSESIRRARDWLTRKAMPDGRIGEEYPNFTTAFSIRAWIRLKPEGWEEATRRMAGYLVKSQCVEGWDSAEPGHGGWGLGGLGVKEKIRLDISTCRHMLEAVADAGRVGDVKPAAKAFVLACQNSQITGKDDGGFCYSRANPHQNKAGGEKQCKTGFRSYGTATADGALALIALGEPAEGFELRLAREWLEKNFSVEAVPGFSSETREPWDKGLLYYYLYAASAALKDSKIGWREPLVRKLQSLQAPDGTWSSAHSLMKEDEPVVATCFALLAWTHAR